MICLIKRLEKSHYFRMAISICKYVVIIKKKTVGIEEDTVRFCSTINSGNVSELFPLYM